jgi:3-hydroxyisobutyrate dehydrogenase-like beta-hydroxyacid dehydrogenase
MPLSDGESVGFIGLGVMGYPMAVQLATKLPSETTINV